MKNLPLFLGLFFSMAFMWVFGACSASAHSHSMSTIIYGNCRNMVEGMGSMQQEIRTLPSFLKVLNESGVSQVMIRIGEPQQVIIRGQSHILPLIKTEVQEGELRIFHEKDTCYRTREKVIVELVVPGLTAIANTGSSEIEGVGIKGKSLNVISSGSGGIHLAGQVQTLLVKNSGSANVLLEQLRVGRAQLIQSGSGNGLFCASENFDGTNSGSGDVRVECGSKWFSFRSMGSGNITATGLESLQIEVLMQGSGNLELRGKAQMVKMGFTGTGNVFANELLAKKVDLEYQGTGNVNLCVSESVTGQGMGAGKIAVSCHPKDVTRFMTRGLATFEVR